MDLVSSAIITLTIAGISGIAVLATKSPIVFLKFKDSILYTCLVVIGVLIIWFYAFNEGLSQKIEISIETYGKGDDWFRKIDTNKVKSKEVIKTVEDAHKMLQYHILSKEIDKSIWDKQDANRINLRLCGLALLLFVVLLYILEHLAKISLQKQNEEKEKANSSTE